MQTFHVFDLVLLIPEVEPKNMIFNSSLSYQLMKEWSDTICCNGGPGQANYTRIFSKTLFPKSGDLSKNLFFCCQITYLHIERFPFIIIADKRYIYIYRDLL